MTNVCVLIFFGIQISILCIFICLSLMLYFYILYFNLYVFNKQHFLIHVYFKCVSVHLWPFTWYRPSLLNVLLNSKIWAYYCSEL